MTYGITLCKEGLFQSQICWNNCVGAHCIYLSVHNVGQGYGEGGGCMFKLWSQLWSPFFCRLTTIFRFFEFYSERREEMRQKWCFGYNFLVGGERVYPCLFCIFCFCFDSSVCVGTHHPDIKNRWHESQFLTWIPTAFQQLATINYIVKVKTHSTL